LNQQEYEPQDDFLLKGYGAKSVTRSLGANEAAKTQRKLLVCEWWVSRLLGIDPQTNSLLYTRKATFSKA
jgi:hypothetical protein